MSRYPITAMYHPGDGPSLGRFLRVRREQLSPGAVGLPTGRRRRTPGLRREELAQLCGVSPTWIAWLEQGRVKSVSVPTMTALAKALKLSRAERAYLFELAGRPDPTRTTAPPASGESLQKLVDAIDTPAYVLDRHWDPVAWNRAASTLFEPWLARPARTHGDAPCNLLRFVFQSPEARKLIAGWSERAERVVAEFRADTARWRGDPVTDALVAELCNASPDFTRYWRQQKVLARDGGQRAFMREGRTLACYEQFTLSALQYPDLKVTVLVPEK
ncbi:MAG: helix-turn-helix transcriptional regulator [Steroidobacteraceae bacterium]